MYKIAVVGGPAERYITRCLDSLLGQHYNKWQACIVLDPSGDNTINEAESYLSSIKDPRFSIIINNRKMYAIPNLLKSFKAMNPTDEDILLTVDADDWFTTLDSLSIVDSYYRSVPELLITYGSWVPFPNASSITNNQSYAEEDFKNLRKCNWRASHLRTFSNKLWRRIKDEDLRDAKGDYYRSAWDLAMMWPMLEMAGYKRSKFIKEKLYTYNQETVFNDSKLRTMEQMKYTDYISNRASYSYIENL